MRSLRFALLSLVCLLVGLVGAGPAAAQSSFDVVEQVDARGYATVGDVDVGVNELEDLARDLRDDDIAVVLLETEWPGGNDLLAIEVVELAEEEWTVLVLSPFEDQLDVGAASATVGSDRIDDALDAAFDQPSRDPIVFARAFADGLEAAGSSGGGGSGGFLIVLLVIVVVVGVGLWLLSKRGKKQGARRIEDAKGELRDDIAGVANDILELGDRADIATNDEASGHFQTANAIYLQVDEALPDASTFDAVDDLDDDLELAAWHLDTAEAIVDGTPRPEKPDQNEPWEGDDRPAASSLPDPPPTQAPRPPSSPAPRPRSRSGGMLGGGGGGGLGTAVLGGVLGSVLGGGGRRGRSRGGLRTTPRNRRSSSRGASSRRRSTPRRSSKGRGRRRG